MRPKNASHIRRLMSRNTPLPPSFESLIEHIDYLKRRIQSLETGPAQKAVQDRTDDALRQSEARFHQLTEHLRDVFFLSAPDRLRFFYVSPSYESVWDSRAADLYSNPAAWLTAVAPEDRAIVEQALQRSRFSGCHDVEYRLTLKNGTVRWLRDRAYPVRHANGTIQYIASLIEDITQRKHDAQQIAALRAQLQQGQPLEVAPPIASPWHDPVKDTAIAEHKVIDEVNQRLNLLNRISTQSWSGQKPHEILEQVVAMLRSFYGNCTVDLSLLSLAAGPQELLPATATLEVLTDPATSKELFSQPCIDIPDLHAGTYHPVLQRCATRHDAGALYGQTFAYAEGQVGLLMLLAKAGHVFSAPDRDTLRDVVAYLTLLLRDARHANERDQALAALRRSDSILRAIFDTLPGYIWFKDAEDRIQMANRLFSETGPLDPTVDPVGKTTSELWPPERAKIYRERDEEVLRTRQPLKYEESCTVQGITRWAEILRVPTLSADGELLGIIGYAHDISEHKQYLALVERARDELEQRVAQRTAELEAANDDLESFSYSVSHDLRAPLRAIDGFTRILQEEYGRQLNNDARNYLHKVTEAAARMNQLIDNLLSLSHMSLRDLRKSRFNLSALAREVMDSIISQATPRPHTIEIAPDLHAQGDPALMRVVLENVLGNAWKFSWQRNHIHISVGRADSLPGRPFFVLDNGAGFDMTYAGKLFKPFQRLHGVNEFEGNGIGLATVQRIISRHGGRVWAESAVDEGTTVYFVLPENNAVGGEPQPPTE
ncbi:MAG: PAS domain S-box protein [Burkholderiaceae bacterium]|nr:MAG: PAS domain S-box protein [Burkholderiaceae bacterium]